MHGLLSIHSTVWTMSVDKSSSVDMSNEFKDPLSTLFGGRLPRGPRGLAFVTHCNGGSLTVLDNSFKSGRYTSHGSGTMVEFRRNGENSDDIHLVRPSEVFLPWRGILLFLSLSLPLRACLFFLSWVSQSLEPAVNHHSLGVSVRAREKHTLRFTVARWILQIERWFTPTYQVTWSPLLSQCHFPASMSHTRYFNLLSASVTHRFFSFTWFTLRCRWDETHCQQVTLLKSQPLF